MKQKVTIPRNTQVQASFERTNLLGKGHVHKPKSNPNKGNMKLHLLSEYEEELSYDENLD